MSNRKDSVVHVRIPAPLRAWLRRRAESERRTMVAQLLVELEHRQRQIEQEQGGARR